MNICLFGADEIGKPLSVRDERGEHIVKILHKKEGDAFTAGIIDGMAGKATISKIAEGNIYFDFVPERPGKPLYPLKMIIGFPRPIQLKRLLRDVAALGACEVHLTGTELGEKSYRQSSLVEKGAAYKMLLDGTVQAGGTFVPKLFMHDTLKECVESIGIESAWNANTFANAGNSVDDAGNSFANAANSVDDAYNTVYDAGNIARPVANIVDVANVSASNELRLALDNINPQCSLTSVLAGRAAFLSGKNCGGKATGETVCKCGEMSAKGEQAAKGKLLANGQMSANGEQFEKDGALINAGSAFSAVAAIGSERGWTDKERKYLESMGFLRCGMGPRIMRTETAATVAASVISAAFGWLE